MQLLGYAFAALIGLSLGVMGGGGSILTVPIFVHVLGFDPKLSVAMSLPVVGATRLVGALGHWKLGNVNLKSAALFGVIAMLGSFAGARLAAFLSGAFQLTLLAVVMLAAAVSMLRSAHREPRDVDLAPDGQRPMQVGLVIPVAIGVGMLTGLVGIGGGFLVVPALVLLGRISMKEAVGTSLLVIAIVAGTSLVRLVSQSALKRAFAMFLLVMGVFILYRNRDVIRPRPLEALPARSLSDVR